MKRNVFKHLPERVYGEGGGGGGVSVGVELGRGWGRHVADKMLRILIEASVWSTVLSILKLFVFSPLFLSDLLYVLFVCLLVFLSPSRLSHDRNRNIHKRDEHGEGGAWMEQREATGPIIPSLHRTLPKGKSRITHKQPPLRQGFPVRKSVHLFSLQRATVLMA